MQGRLKPQLIRYTKFTLNKRISVYLRSVNSTEFSFLAALCVLYSRLDTEQNFLYFLSPIQIDYAGVYCRILCDHEKPQPVSKIAVYDPRIFIPVPDGNRIQTNRIW